MNLSDESTYPSATKTSPEEDTATDVGLQKCFSSFPGMNWVPRTTIFSHVIVNKSRMGSFIHT